MSVNMQWVADSEYIDEPPIAVSRQEYDEESEPRAVVTLHQGGSTLYLDDEMARGLAEIIAMVCPQQETT